MIPLCSFIFSFCCFIFFKCLYLIIFPSYLCLLVFELKQQEQNECVRFPVLVKCEVFNVSCSLAYRRRTTSTWV